jgi:predicted RNA binding protein YcfA (HicA-like mRNA interferase family)
MPRLRRQSGREVITALQSVGFALVATRGSHAKMQRTTAGGRQTLTIPLHDELAVGTLQAIYRQALRYVEETALKPLFYSD